MFSVYYHGTKKAAIPLLPRFRRLGEIYAKRISVWVAGLSDPTKLFLILYEHGFNHAKRGVAEKVVVVVVVAVVLLVLVLLVLLILLLVVIVVVVVVVVVVYVVVVVVVGGGVVGGGVCVRMCC